MSFIYSAHPLHELSERYMFAYLDSSGQRPKSCLEFLSQTDTEFVLKHPMIFAYTLGWLQTP